MATKNTHTKQRTTFDNVKDAVSQVKNIGDKEITVFVGKGTAKTNEPFVILFYQSFIRLVVNQQLAVTDLKVMLGILDFVSRGNIVHLTHQEIAEHVQLQRPQVSKSIKRLLAAELLIQSTAGSLFVNPTIMSKESLRSVKESTAYQIVADRAKQQGTEEALTF
jgi:hypothetical protein